MQGGSGSYATDTYDAKQLTGAGIGMEIMPDQTQLASGRPAVVPRPGAGLPAGPIPASQDNGTKEVPYHNTRQHSHYNSGMQRSTRSTAGLSASNTNQQNLASPSGQHNYQMRSSSNSRTAQYRSGESVKDFKFASVGCFGTCLIHA